MVGGWLIISRLTMHNVHHLLSLMRAARNAIIEDRFALFVHGFFARYYEDKPVPSWATDALAVVGINLKQQAAGSLPD
jgi:queuine tRNA-ribosyltransferase catalytic subunit